MWFRSAYSHWLQLTLCWRSSWDRRIWGSRPFPLGPGWPATGTTLFVNAIFYEAFQHRVSLFRDHWCGRNTSRSALDSSQRNCSAPRMASKHGSSWGSVEWISRGCAICVALLPSRPGLLASPWRLVYLIPVGIFAYLLIYVLEPSPGFNR